jgi:hypothetical protein
MGERMEIREHLAIFLPSPSFEQERRHEGKRVGLTHGIMTV